jgi:glucose/arabinose dehydrogenase
MFLTALAVSTATCAGAEDAVLLTGKAAYGDWKTDAPGVRRLITPVDLPPPRATSSAFNAPSGGPRPAGAELKVPPGFHVSLFLTHLKEPRQLKVAPNGDVFLAESEALSIRIIHSAANADTASGATVFADHLPERPYGIAFYPPGNDPQYLYVATEGHVLRYPYHTGDMQARAKAEVIVPDLPIGHHWTRDIIFTADGSKMLVSVGSASNDGENGMAAESFRADVLEFNPDGSGKRVYASGLRNPVSLAENPSTHAFWTTVNERDGLGDDLPPDFVTSLAPGGFYGWPFYYTGMNLDLSHKTPPPELKDKSLAPDVLLQPHSAPLGCAFYTGQQFPPEYSGDLFVALHGSWNREKRTGYKLVRVRFKDGKATGEYDDFLTGFILETGIIFKGDNVWGRPVGVAMAQDGSLLMSDDGSGTVWKISYQGK